jgi:hypothetical protein
MLRLLHALAGAFGAFAMLTFLSVNDAKADDAYICDDGRLVYAKPSTLEKLKATDPCIAKYFKTTPQPLPQSAPVASQPTGTNAGALPTPPAPRFKPAVGAPTTKDARIIDKPKAPEAAQGTDFRNVRVINATAGQADIYRHTR